MNAEQIPPSSYEIDLVCFKCGQRFKSHTEANISEPETLAMVRRMMCMVLCNQCHGRTKPAGTFTGPTLL